MVGFGGAEGREGLHMGRSSFIVLWLEGRHNKIYYYLRSKFSDVYS